MEILKHYTEMDPTNIHIIYIILLELVEKNVNSWAVGKSL